MLENIDNKEIINPPIDTLSSKRLIDKSKDISIEDIIKDLSDGHIEDISSIKIKIERFYNKNPRHKYSDITRCLMNIILEKNKNNKIDSQKSEENIIYISANIEKILKEYSSNQAEDCKELTITKLHKLQDHILLEVLRLKHIIEMSADIEKASEQVKENKNLVEKASEEAKENKKSYITILGIFSSILLSFVAGITFSNSVLANMHKVDIFKLGFVICCIVLFITNILNRLFIFLTKYCFEKEYKDNITPFNLYILVFAFIFLVFYLISQHSYSLLDFFARNCKNT